MGDKNFRIGIFLNKKLLGNKQLFFGLMKVVSK